MHHLDGKCRNHETALAREAKFWFDLYKFHVSNASRAQMRPFVNRP